MQQQYCADWRQREAALEAQLTALQGQLLHTAHLPHRAAPVSPAQPAPQPGQSMGADQLSRPSEPAAETPLSGVSPAGTSVPPPSPNTPEIPQPPQAASQQQPHAAPRDPATNLAAQLQSAVNSPDATDVLRDESVDYLSAPYAARRPGAPGSQQQQPEPSVRDLPVSSAVSALEAMLNPSRSPQQPQQQAAAASSAAAALEPGSASAAAAVPTSPPTLAVGADDVYWMAQLHQVGLARGSYEWGQVSAPAIMCNTHVFFRGIGGSCITSKCEPALFCL